MKWPGWISIWKNLVDDLEIPDSQKSALLSEKVKKKRDRNSLLQSWNVP